MGDKANKLALLFPRNLVVLPPRVGFGGRGGDGLGFSPFSTFGVTNEFSHVKLLLLNVLASRAYRMLEGLIRDF